MHDSPPGSVAIDIADLRSFAARLRADIDHVLQPALNSVDSDVGAVLTGARPNQALGNHELNPAAQWIGAGIELNLRGVAGHLADLIESMRFLSELADVIATENENLDDLNAVDVARFGEFATRARGAVEDFHASQWDLTAPRQEPT